MFLSLISPQETSKEILQARDDLMKAIQAFLKEVKSRINLKFYKILLLSYMNDLAKFLKEFNKRRRSKQLKLGIVPLFYFDDDDDEYTVIWRRPKAITPDEPIEEPDNSLSMGDEHLSTIPEMESDKVIKSGVENLVPILSEFEGISDDTCDVALDDDDFKVVEEYVSLNKRVNVEKEFDLEDIFQIQDSPSSFSIPVTDSDSFFEKSDTSLSYSDNSLPEFEPFSDDTEETRSGSTTTHADNSLPEYDSFPFEIEPDQGGLTSVFISDNSNDPLLELLEFESFHFDLYDDPSFPRPPPEPPDVEISLIFEPDAPVINNFDELNKDECFDPGGGEIDVSQNVKDDNSFIFVIWTFLLYLTYPMDSPLLLSTRSEDTIFNPTSPLRAGGISLGWNFHDCLDFEGSRAHGFVRSYIRASYPQLHLGNPIS
ncbi:hypothetical protein Tco_1430932 [Tanacetum coccineum]